MYNVLVAGIKINHQSLNISEALNLHNENVERGNVDVIIEYIGNKK